MLLFGHKKSSIVEAVDNNGNVYVLGPKVKEDNTFVGEFVEGKLVAPDVKDDMDVLGRHVLNAKRNTKVVSGKASTAKKQTKKAVAKKNDKSETAKRVDSSRNFTFAAIGVQPGDKVNFVDGKEVVVVDDNKVSYEGSTYTLSGFCKTFMPDAKRNKSNSYRGCVFFYKEGVKLEKLFNEALKVEERPTEVVANETHEEAVANENPQTDACAETETEKLVVNACAEENPTEKPCSVRSVPLSALQPINYPLRILARCGVVCHTNARNKRVPESSGRPTKKNVHTFSLPPPPLLP